MISYSVLFINKKLRRAEAFSEILTNLPKQKLEVMKLNNLKNLVVTLINGTNFFKKCISARINEYHN